PVRGRLPRGGGGAIGELEARWLLGDVDVDRCPREEDGYPCAQAFQPAFAFLPDWRGAGLSVEGREDGDRFRGGVHGRASGAFADVEDISGVPRLFTMAAIYR